MNSVIILSKSRISIHNDTTNDIAKKHFHKDKIANIKAESTEFKLLHISTYCSFSVDVEYTTKDLLAGFLRYVLTPDDVTVSTERDNVKDKNEAAGDAGE